MGGFFSFWAELLGGFRTADGPADVWQEGDVAGTLDGSGKLALVAGARSGLAARANLALFGDKALQELRVLVINQQRLVRAKGANARSRCVPAHCVGLYLVCSRFFGHIFLQESQ
jgi:hypothetical protein